MRTFVTPWRRDESDDPQSTPTTVLFRVAGLIGLSKQSIPFPLGAGGYVESGQIALTIDPEATASSNVGVVDFEKRMLHVTYGVHAIFPGLSKLVREQRLEPALQNPVRAVATDRCTVTDDLKGWHAVGRLRFLQGSVWSGATGG